MKTHLVWYYPTPQSSNTRYLMVAKQYKGTEGLYIKFSPDPGGYIGVLKTDGLIAFCRHGDTIWNGSKWAFVNKYKRTEQLLKRL